MIQKWFDMIKNKIIFLMISKTLRFKPESVNYGHLTKQNCGIFAYLIIVFSLMDAYFNSGEPYFSRS